MPVLFFPAPQSQLVRQPMDSNAYYGRGQGMTTGYAPEDAAVDPSQVYSDEHAFTAAAGSLPGLLPREAAPDLSQAHRDEEAVAGQAALFAGRYSDDDGFDPSQVYSDEDAVTACAGSLPVHLPGDAGSASDVDGLAIATAVGFVLGQELMSVGDFDWAGSENLDVAVSSTASSQSGHFLGDDVADAAEVYSDEAAVSRTAGFLPIHLSAVAGPVDTDDAADVAAAGSFWGQLLLGVGDYFGSAEGESEGFAVSSAVSPQSMHFFEDAESDPEEVYRDEKLFTGAVGPLPGQLGDDAESDRGEESHHDDEDDDDEHAITGFAGSVPGNHGDDAESDRDEESDHDDGDDDDEHAITGFAGSVPGNHGDDAESDHGEESDHDDEDDDDDEQGLKGSLQGLLF